MELFKPQRNYGIDLLRIVSMFMIVLLHSLGHGGALGGTAALSANYRIAWLLESAAYCAVNCFALVSGYVGLRSRFKLSGIVLLWLQVVFYHAIFTVVWAVVDQRAIDLALMADALMPVRKNAYWYYTAYFAISFFMPLLNAAVEHLDKRTLALAVLGIILLFSVYPTVTATDIFKTGGGYHGLWLMVIYLLGAAIKKYDPLTSWRKWVWALVYLAMVLLSWGVMILEESVTGLRLPNLIQYTSPTILLAAISLLMLFSGIRPAGRAQKLIALLSPLTFGVYLIHDSLFIRKKLISGSLAAAGGGSALGMLVKILGFALAVFCVCLLVEYGRSRLFQAIGIKKRLDALEKKWLQKT